MVDSQLTRTQVELLVLGPLVATVGGRAVGLAGAKARTLLAVLVLHANETVSVDRLIDALWPDDPPATARNTLQAHVSRLRRALGGRIGPLAGGYSLAVRPDELDLIRFRTLVAAARRARSENEAQRAAELLRDALSLWRGPALSEFAGNAALAAEIARLEEEHLSAVEERIDVELELGEGPTLVAELESAVAENPLRERLMGQLMVALYRSGRQADALDLYGKARRRLVGELGLEPAPMLTDLHRRILAHDPALNPARRSPVRESASPSRRNLTVALVEISLSREIDPEVAGRTLEQTRARARSVFEAHAAVVASVEDGLVATFGLPATGEDDAMRAIQAASEAVDALDLTVAVDSGVALATQAELVDEHFVGRLRDLARAGGTGDVVVGAGVRALLGDAVELDGSVLVSVDAAAEPIPRNLDAPLIGRDTEYRRLRESFDWSVGNRRSHLVTIVGAAGIGKSRLTRELVDSVSGEATVLTGRSLAYGGGAFWPLAEVVKQAAGDTTPDALARVLEDLDDRKLVVDQLAAALGTGTGIRAEDAFWAFRKFFVALASKRPLVLAFEDLHWGEERLLDFIEELVERAEEARILVICLARPDLLDQRPSWGGGSLDSESIQLLPLSEASSQELIRTLGASVSEEAQAQIATRAEGNPLFIEQLVALAGEDPGAPADAIPASIHAVLAARVDRLERDERVLLERASIVGLEFTAADVSALSTDASSDEILGTVRRLVRKDLLRPAGPEIRGRDDYRFRHILIRDVIYSSVLKATRAELHERFARWLEADLSRRSSEIEEIIGYHLERSYELRKELDPAAESLHSLASEAGRRLASAAEQRLRRSETIPAIDLLERSRVLLDDESARRCEVLASLASAYRLTGMWDQSREALEEAVGLAESGCDKSLLTSLEVSGVQLRLHTEKEFGVDQFLDVMEDAASAIADDAGSDAGRVRGVLAWAYALTGQTEAAERTINNLVASGVPEVDPRKLLPSLWLIGPLPATEAIVRCEALLSEEPPPRTAASCYRALAVLRAMRGEFVSAHMLCDRDEQILEELGLSILRAASTGIRATVYSLEGRGWDAECELRTGIRRLAELDESLHAGGLRAQLARVLLDQGKNSASRRVLKMAEGVSGQDVAHRVELLGVRSRLEAADGGNERAVPMAREAVGLADETDSPDLQGTARMDLGHALRTTAQLRESKRVFRDALHLFQRKGNLVEARDVIALLGQ